MIGSKFIVNLWSDYYGRACKDGPDLFWLLELH